MVIHVFGSQNFSYYSKKMIISDTLQENSNLVIEVDYSMIEALGLSTCFDYWKDEIDSCLDIWIKDIGKISLVSCDSSADLDSIKKDIERKL